MKKAPLRYILALLASASIWPACGLIAAQTEADRQISERNKIIAVIPEDFSPTYFKDTATGRPKGFAVDVLDLIAKRTGLEVEYIYGKPWEDMYNMVITGRADLIPSLTISPERSKILSFTNPIEIQPVSLIVTAQSTITEITPDITIGTIAKSVTTAYLKKNYKTVRVIEFDGMSRLLFELLAGHIDAAFTLAPNILKIARDADIENKIKVIHPPVFESKRGMAVRKDDTVLLNRLNDSIHGLLESSEYKTIYVKWFGEPRPFWTPFRIIVISSIILLLSIFIMAIWRYASLININSELSHKIEEIKTAEELIRKQTMDLHSAYEELEAANEELTTVNEELIATNEELHHSTRIAEQNELRMNSYFTNAPDAIFIVDQDGRYVDLNPAACSLLGYSKEDIVSRPIVDLIAPESHHAGIKSYQNLINSGSDKSELSYVMKNHSRVHVSQNSSRLPDGNYIIFCVDMTDRLLAQEEKAKLEEQLRQSQKMEALGLLAGGVAHDFNNILQAITGFGSLLKYDISKDEVGEYADEILKSSARAAELTKNLLTFSRKQKMEMKAIDINKVILEIQKFITRIIGEDITFEIHMQNAPLIINADHNHLQQAIINLVTNARDAMRGGGRLSISVKPIRIEPDELVNPDVDRAGDYACITISDTGSGIPEKDIEHIFEPFFTTKSKDKGTGLGLPIVYGIIKQHCGYISLNSKADAGTTFKIFLPIVEAKESVDSDPKSETITGGDESILIVEDDQAVQSVLAQTLKLAGYNIMVAGSGLDALNIIKSDRAEVDMVILDIIMPEMNGSETLNELRKIRPDIKALFISGYTADILDEKGLMSKDMQLLIKPVLRDDLLKKLREILDA